MIYINITNFRKNIFNFLENTIKFNEPISISTKEGNAVLISEDEYNGLLETMYLTQDSQVKQEIIKGMKTPISDCLTEEEVNW